MSMQHVQYVLLFLVLAVNSKILQSYMLLLKPPVLMRAWRSNAITSFPDFI